MAAHHAAPRATRADALLAFSLSFTAHVVLSFVVWLGGLTAGEVADGSAAGAGRQPLSSASRDGAAIDIEVESTGSARSRTALPMAGGGEAMPRPDSGRAGRGGDGLVLASAVNLAPRDDRAQLSPALRSRLERAQQARTRTGRERRSPEDDRVSPDPMLLTFVADGDGRRPDPRLWSRPRRPDVRQAARSGVQRAARLEGTDGGEAQARLGRDGEAPREPRPPWLTSSSAAPSHARPMTVAGRESSPTNERGEQQDDVNAEQEVMARERSWLRASTAGGEPGEGIGGEKGPSARTGSGGRAGPGSRARALGSGRGSGFGIDPADRRRRNYLRTIWGRIDRSWSAADFPKQAALEGKQGYTIIGFVVRADGRVTQARVARSSGFPQFDARMLAVVQRVGPFGPLPPELGPVLRHHHEFVVSNPAVRPNR